MAEQQVELILQQIIREIVNEEDQAQIREPEPYVIDLEMQEAFNTIYRDLSC